MYMNNTNPDDKTKSILKKEISAKQSPVNVTGQNHYMAIGRVWQFVTQHE